MEKVSNITPELIRRQLQSILDFEEIKKSPILSKFLDFVVSEKLAGHADEIKEYTIGVKALGKPSDFNPQMDAIVRIHAGRLRRTLLNYYQGIGKNDSLLILIPKGTYVPIFKIPDSGFFMQSLLQNGEKITDHLESNFDIEHSNAVLAVLPFQNLSDDKSTDYFVTGLGEQLSADLARFQNISVITYFSTDTSGLVVNDFNDVKKRINVNYLLSGSVRILNEMVQMNVQLILSENKKHIWSGTFTRYLTSNNIVDIQEEIINQVVNMIADDNGIIIKLKQANASPAPKSGSLKVQEAIYQYYYYTIDYNEEKFVKAIKALEEAIIIDPENALVNALLSGLYIDIYASSVQEEAKILEEATRLAHIAVKLDENCQAAQKSLAWCLLFSRKKENCMDVMEYCINLNPKSSTTLATMGLGFVCLGEYKTGFKYLVRSAALNPNLPASTKLGFAIYNYNKKNFTESQRWIERLLPFEAPFMKLLKLANIGKLNKKKMHQNVEKVLDLKDHARNIINRMILDSKLRQDITRGIKLAGLSLA